MRKLYVIFFLPLFLPAISQADSPIACVESDVANTLLTYPGANWDEKFSYDRPAGITLPGEQSSFSLIGSRTSQMMTMISFKVAREVAEVEQNIRNLAGEEGWIDLMAHMPFSTRGGFQSSSSRNLFNMLNFCHDEHGNVQVFVTDNPESGSYVRYSVTARQNFQGCANPMNAFMAMSPVELPTLSLPNGVEVVESSGIGGGPNSRRSTTVLRSTEYHAGLLADHFNEQIGKQSLSMESGWSDAAFSGSVWTAPEGDRYVTLIVVDVGEGSYRATLRAEVMGKDAAKMGLGSSVRIGSG